MINITSRKFFRPYITNVNNVARIVRQIHIYDENGIILTSNQGWLQHKNGGDIKELHLSTDKDLILRRKERFDGEVYIMNVDPDWRNEKQCVLYIPNDLVKFEKVKRELTTYYTIVDIWESNILNSVIVVNRNEFKLDERLRELEQAFNEIKDDYDFKIDDCGLTDYLIDLEYLADEYSNEVDRIKSIDINSL